MTQVGILALQGGVTEHRSVLSRLGITSQEVRSPDDLRGLTHLVIPGGESTVMAHWLDAFGLRTPIVSAAKNNTLAVFGTCAGAILLANRLVGEGNPVPLGLLDMTVNRNAYGSQLDSFETRLKVNGIPKPIRACFIRAPIIERTGKHVEILSRYQDRPVVVRSGRLLAATCHPELRDETALHQLFLSM